MKYIKSFAVFENAGFLDSVYNDIRKAFKSLPIDKQSQIVSKFELLKTIKIPNSNLQDYFKKEMKMYRQPSDFFLWLDYVARDPFLNDNELSTNKLSYGGYKLYYFDDSIDFNEYLEVSTGTMWCTRQMSYYLTHISEDYIRSKGFYVLVNNNIRDYRNEKYKMYIKLSKENYSNNVSTMYNRYLSFKETAEFFKDLPNEISDKLLKSY